MEVSIFQKDNPEKVLIGTIMDHRTPTVGLIILDMIPLLNRAHETFSFSGPVSKGICDTEEYEWVHADNKQYFAGKLVILGDASYVIHSLYNDNSVKSVLPGIHDIDIKAATNITIDTPGFDDGSLETIHSRSYIDKVKEMSPILEGNNILSSWLLTMINVTRNHLNMNRPNEVYRKAVGNNVIKAKVLKIQEFRDLVDEDVLYKEIVNDYYLLKINDEDTMLKIQIDMTVSSVDGEIVGTDHIFELIVIVDNYPSFNKERKYNETFDTHVRNGLAYIPKH